MRRSDKLTMNRESFLETIRQQYADEIREAYIECEHDDHGSQQVDFAELNRRLNKLRSSAKLDGLAVTEFEELARATLPDGVAEKVEFAPVRKAA
jgi:hypothetical protein